MRHVFGRCGLPELFRTVYILAKVYYSNVKELKPKLNLIGKFSPDSAQAPSQLEAHCSPDLITRPYAAKGMNTVDLRCPRLSTSASAKPAIEQSAR